MGRKTPLTGGEPQSKYSNNLDPPRDALLPLLCLGVSPKGLAGIKEPGSGNPPLDKA